MKQKSQQAKLQKKIQDSQKQKQGHIDFEIKHILTRGYEVQFFSNFDLFLIYNEIKHHCWNLINNNFQQNLPMNNFLNDDFSHMADNGPYNSDYLLKSDNYRLRIYDLINFKKINTSIPSQLSNFFQDPYTSQIIITKNNFITYYTFESKQRKRIIINTSDQIDTYQTGIYLSEVFMKCKYYQLRKKSLKILRNKVDKLKFIYPSHFCQKFLIQQQSQNNKHSAIIYNKDSMKIKFQTKIQKDLEDYIYIQEKDILIILITQKVLIFNSISFELIRNIQTHQHPKKIINFMSFERNTLSTLKLKLLNIYEIFTIPFLQLKKSSIV
ncbi:hypothetical protein pb186bvf_019704 [Paramecium bursaria]